MKRVLILFILIISSTSVFASGTYECAWNGASCYYKYVEGDCTNGESPGSICNYPWPQDDCEQLSAVSCVPEFGVLQGFLAFLASMGIPISRKLLLRFK